MSFLFTGLFWGCLIILFGLSVILKAVFHIHFPIFRVLLGVILIYWGLTFVIGKPWLRCGAPRNTVLFEERTSSVAAEGGEYSVIFGKSTIDASGPLTEKSRRIQVTTVFGQSTVIISSTIPTLVRVSSAFAGARLPDGNIASFGEYTYRNKACEGKKPERFVHVNVVFGGADIVEVGGTAGSAGSPRSESPDSTTTASDVASLKPL
jgi:hypothetical protein